MVTPNRRRQAVSVLEDEFGVSQRRACVVVGQPRSTQRLPARSHRLRNNTFVSGYGRSRNAGPGGVGAALRKGFAVKASRLMTRKSVACGVMRAFGFLRDAIAAQTHRSIDADHVVAVLDRLCVERGGPPAFVRFDNGPEFVANAIADWCRFNHVDAVFIDPGSPWQNAWIESFNGRLRDELLNLWHFDSLLEARVLIEDWRRDYNTNRPHSAHGDLTPTEFHLRGNDRNQKMLS